MPNFQWKNVVKRVLRKSHDERENPVWEKKNRKELYKVRRWRCNFLFRIFPLFIVSFQAS